MSTTVLQLCTTAARWINLISESDDLPAEQGQTALELLNNMMASMFIDGIELGWYAQDDLADMAPIEDGNIREVELCLAKDLASFYGLAANISEPLKVEMGEAAVKLAKRTMNYFESDLTADVPMPQGSYSGGRA